MTLTWAACTNLGRCSCVHQPQSLMTDMWHAPCRRQASLPKSPRVRVSKVDVVDIYQSTVIITFLNPITAFLNPITTFLNPIGDVKGLVHSSLHCSVQLALFSDLMCSAWGQLVLLYVLYLSLMRRICLTGVVWEYAVAHVAVISTVLWVFGRVKKLRE